jgi:predicted ferric reductase
LTLRASPFSSSEHPFSFSGSAVRKETIEFSIRELGDFTRTIGQTKPGDTAYVDGPYGVFTTDRHPRAPGFVFVAGGVGIAPIMSMLRTLADRGDERPLRLVYGNKRWEEVLFREELEVLASRVDLKIVHVIEDPPPEWAGETGRITRSPIGKAMGGTADDFVFFLCGPKAMSDALQRELYEMGVPLRRIHFELFDMV